MSYRQNQARRKQPLPSLSQQQGVVIVVALFIIALAATMATVMMARLDRDTQRTSLLTRNVQAEADAQGSLAWAIDMLQSNFQEQKRYKLIDQMPIQSEESIVNGYKIVSKVDDMQARFNLNNLSEAESRETFKRLLHIIDPQLTAQQIQELTQAIVDWISAVGGDGAEELGKYYMQLPKPYRAAHMLMQSQSELQLVKGMTPALYKNLQPYIVALPMVTPLNVQTAPAQILTALSPTMSMNVAETVVLLRKEQPFNNTEDFTALEIVRDKGVKDKLTINSNYFLVETKVAIEEQKLVLYTLLERDDEGKVRILWQSKGIW